MDVTDGQAKGLGDGEAPVTRESIAAWIQDYCGTCLNSLNLDGEAAWGAPLIGFAKGDDPLFAEMPRHIGEFYWTPEQAFLLAFPGARAAELSVICWILPQTSATKADNRKEKAYPAERWARSRKYGEEFNNALHDKLVAAMMEAGVPAAAPSRHPEWGWRTSPGFSFASNWSHRHAAYVAGLGTFGLCDALITPVGKAMRCGSIIAKLDLPPTPRPYHDPHAYCLYFAKGTCGACMRRCPAGAITPEGHDKELCKSYVMGTTSEYVRENFGFEAYGCGLCQVGVPCESGIPRGLEPTDSESE